MIRQGSLGSSLKRGLTMKKKDDATRRQEVSEALAKESTLRFACTLSDGNIQGQLVFLSPDEVVFVQGTGGSAAEVRIVETIVLEQVTRYHRDGNGFIVRWDKKSEACFLSDAVEVLLVSFDRIMLRKVAGVSTSTFFSPRKETLRQSLTPDSPNPSTDMDESDDDAETLLMDRSAVARFPKRSALTQRVIEGPRFVGLWTIRLKKAITDVVEKVPCIIVASGQGMAVLLPSLRLLKPIFWSAVPSFGSNKDSFGIIEMQANKVRICFFFQLVAAKHLVEACQAALRLYGETRGAASPFPQLYPRSGPLTTARLGSESSEGDVQRAERRVTLISRRLSANAKDLAKDETKSSRRFTTLFVHAAVDIDPDDNTDVLDMLEEGVIPGK